MPTTKETPPPVADNLRRAVARIIEDVLRFGRLTLVDVERVLTGHGVPATGDRELAIVPNGITWQGASPEYLAALRAILADGRVALDAAQPDEYEREGRALDLPLARRPPRNLRRGYLLPRWWVVVLRPVADIERDLAVGP